MPYFVFFVAFLPAPGLPSVLLVLVRVVRAFAVLHDGAQRVALAMDGGSGGLNDTRRELLSASHRLVLRLVSDGWSLGDLEALGPGTSSVLVEALERCRRDPPSDWPAQAYVLIHREDIARNMALAAADDRSARSKGASSSGRCCTGPGAQLLFQRPATAPDWADAASRDSVSAVADDLGVQEVDGMEGITEVGLDKAAAAAANAQMTQRPNPASS